MECPLLPSLEIGASREDAELCVLLMHGLGADGNDFAEVAMHLNEAAQPRKWRFVLPHAPRQAVTINMGARMPSWYDILELDHPRSVNWETVAESAVNIEALLDHERADKIVLAGFSQGAAMALHVGLRRPDSIAGVLMMSGYLLESEAHPCPEQSTEFSLGVFHGTDDSMVPFAAAELSIRTLQAKGYSPTLKAYSGLDHSVSEEELRDVFAWLESV